MINRKIRTLLESQYFAQHEVRQLTQSPTFTTAITRLVKQHVQIVVIREARFRDHNIKEEEDNDRDTLLQSLISVFQDS